MSLVLHNFLKFVLFYDIHRAKEKSLHSKAEESAETMKNEEAEDPIK